MSQINGVGLPGGIRSAGTVYKDKKSGILYVQNQAPRGNSWTPLDTNYLDDGTSGPGSMFTGGTVVGATNFQSTISSGGTNLNSIFAQINHTHPISDITNLQSTLNLKSPLANPTFVGTVTIGDLDIEFWYLDVHCNITRTSLYASTSISTGSFIGNIRPLVDGSDSLLDNDFCLFVDATTTLTLPDNPTNGRMFIIKMSRTGGRTLTITPGLDDTIEEISSFATSAASVSRTFIFNSSTSDWLIIASV